MQPKSSLRSAAFVVSLFAMAVLAACGSSSSSAKGNTASLNGALTTSDTDPGIAACAPSYSYTPPTPVTSFVFNVTSYGAAGNGTTNSSPAITTAIAAAQAHGGEVYIPAGKFLIMTKIVIPAGTGITISGAGRSETTLMMGAPGQTMFTVQADHTTIENATLDAQITGGNPIVLTGANYVWLLHLEVLGAPGGSWPIRFAGGHGSSPAHPTYATGNVVDDVILYDTAPQQNDGLGFAFQSNAVIANLVHHGSRIGLYVDKDVTIFNDDYTPNSLDNGGEKGYVITTPSSNIVISHFTSSGWGGKINSVPTVHPRGGNTHITICYEQMTGASSNVFSIGDVTDLSISNSRFGTVQVDPASEAQGTLTNSTYASLQDEKKSSGATISLQQSP
jgi:polygalacturonase